MSFILSLLSIETMGVFCILLIMGRSRYKFSVLEFLSLAFYIGIGFVVVELFLYHVAGIDYGFKKLMMLPAILFVVALASKATRTEDLFHKAEKKAKFTRLETFLIAAVAIQFIWVLVQVAPMPVHSHDAVANYALKAKIFFTSGGIPDGFFSWGEETVAHPDYPLLLPLLLTWIYEFTGMNVFVVNLVMPIIYLSFLGLFYSQIRRMFGRAYSLLIIFFLATIPQIADYATIVYADLILMAMVTCAFTYFILYLRSGDKIQIHFASILFGFSLWLKNEANVFVLAFFICLILLALNRKRSKQPANGGDLGASIILVGVIAFPWLLVKFTEVSVNSDMNMGALTFSKIWQNIKDIPILLNLFQQEVFGPKKWNIFWVILFTCILWKRKRLNIEENFYLKVFLLVSVVCYFVAYMCTTGYNLFFYVNTTVSRFMIHFCGICMLLIAFLMKDDVEELIGKE